MTLKRTAEIFANKENDAITVKRIKQADKRLRRGEFSQRMYDVLCCYLSENEFVLDRRSIIEYISKVQIDFDFTYKELFSLSDHIVRVISDRLGELNDTILENAVNTLRMVDLINTEKLLALASRAEKYLISRDDIRYSDWAHPTKIAKRNEIILYAEKHGVSEFDAAQKTADVPIQKRLKNAGKIYFVTMYALILFFVVTAMIFGIGPVVTFFLIFPFSQCAKDITDRIFSYVCKDTTVPRLKIDSVPKDGTTLVVITTLLTGEKNDKQRFDDLEDYYLSNRSENLVFGILGDLRDSSDMISAEDEKIVLYAEKRINALNAKYNNRFSLFIRQRRYSTGEGKYIAWERKRGAVLELIRLIKRRPTSFYVSIADRMFLHSVKYLITLDSDTRLYPGAVFDLIGAMLHPENKPVIEKGRVISGYAVMQPRMDTSLGSAGKTAFTSMLCGSGGIDVYSGAAFDVYQNVFGEGIFCGKGIIAVDAYFELLNEAFPEERVLSHDLLEGERLRCAMLTDIVLCDCVPTNPVSWFERQHRWSRGDTQAMAFCGCHIRNSKGERIETPMSRLSIFKIMDNMRRLLLPIFTVAAIITSFNYDYFRSGITVLFALSYMIIRLVLSLPLTIKNITMRFFSHVLASAGHTLSNFVYDISALFHTAWVNLNALMKSLYRMIVSKKYLLEWTTAEHSEMFAKTSFPYYFFKMSGSLAVGIIMFIYAPSGWHKTLGLFWIAMPFASYMLSKKHNDTLVLNHMNAKRLREYTRTHWNFMRTYVTYGDNFLPPDNVSFRENEKIAHRTSPTNIGLYLLSVICVCDLGYISVGEMQRRVDETLSAVEKLEKWNGFLYNWYDTQTLEVIGRRFVSSVDCGNFGACIIALREGLKEYSSESLSIVSLIARLDTLIETNDYSVFLDHERDLLAIGYDAERKTLTESSYDIYMTECRTASYIATAQGNVGREHWASLARILAANGGYMGMLSWNGTMFEYFMPNLFLPIYRNSLEFESLNFATLIQSSVKYHGVWGKSECAYAAINESGDYKYKAVGLSKLGIEHDLDDMHVIAPYASFLACTVAPNAACVNLSRLQKLGCYCEYGFYDSLDFNSGKAVPTRCCMSHHIGMSIVAAHNALLENKTQRRFISCPMMHSVSDLLKEKIPLNPRISKTKNIYPTLYEMKSENLRF